MTAFDTFPGDYEYQLLKNAYRTRTLCDLSAQGARREARERRPPAVVTLSSLPPNYTPRPLCTAETGRVLGM